MKFYYSLILSIVLSVALCFSTQAQDTANKPLDIASALNTIATDPALSQALLGVCIRTEDGQTIAQHNAKTMLVPASNMKLITTGAALHTLGSDYCYETKIGYSGTIQDGTLNGNLYIIGGGDPTIGSIDSIAVKTNSTFAQWEKMIKNAGIKKIDGHIIGDGRWVEGEVEETSWSWQDIGTYYGTGVTGLMFYENMLSYNILPGKELGEPIELNASYPKTPWMTINNEATTGKAGTGDQTYMYTSEFAPVGAVRGTFAIDKGKKRVDFSNKFPEYTCAVYFEKYLDGKGVSCTKGAADFRLKNEWRGAQDEDITIIGSTKSPNLKRIALSTNHVSNNLFAETLLRTLGKELLGSTDYEVSRTALNNVLKKMGLDTKSLHVDDGSGLSRQNYVSADFLCSFLKAMMASPAYSDFVYGLPSPGGNGTLQFNMRSHPDELKTRIKAKSGSMNGIRCYSGYVLPSTSGGKTIIFSILTGNCTAPSWKVRQLLDKLMATIAESN
jgi:D-alanyl-D-alanine carboxypeptidase/D-alanyl-D-alanine-endopeptidase (penicillin-binding protein 4)